MKKKDKKRQSTLIKNLAQISAKGTHLSTPNTESSHSDIEYLDLDKVGDQAILDIKDSNKTARMKKFRFQLLHQWLISSFAPCKVADIGGGKGLLSYLLINSGWSATVIDPFYQSLPNKYKDIVLETRVKISPKENVPFITSEFEVSMGHDFDLLIGMHAHGSNAKIIDAAHEFGCGFVLFPCCVIDEPFYPSLGVHWIESLAYYAISQNFPIKSFRLNFKGQNIGIYYPGKTQELRK